MKREKVLQSLLDSTEKNIREKMIYLDSIVKREIRKDKEIEKFSKSFEKDSYNLLKKIANELDEINIFLIKDMVLQKVYLLIGNINFGLRSINHVLLKMILIIVLDIFQIL